MMCKWKTIAVVAAVILACAGGTQAQDSPGNMNYDTVVNGLDVGAFVLAMLDPPGYALAYPGCDWNNADLDCDTEVDTNDIPLFVDCVLNGNCDPCGVVIETVTVGNPGNAGEWSGESYGGSGEDAICGDVPYVYNIGKYEVTAGQYCEFLNAVAASDTYSLYNSALEPGRIERSGSSGSYTYSVVSDRANRAVYAVSWGDAARFANWLHNDQPTGAQDLTTTEHGSYFLNGATSYAELMAITREPNATWVIPTEDEWYKAAYHKNDGITANYYDYPTSNNSVPSNDLVDPDPGNNATFYDGGYTSPYCTTEAGAHENSESPYDTFDQGGNVREWNEALLYDERFRGVRGGSYKEWVIDAGTLLASYRSYAYPTTESDSCGFRVAELP